MKSGEVKPRGRPPGRKTKIQQKNSSASENENNRSIRAFFSPPQGEPAQDDRKRGGSTPRRRKNPLANLQSDLSPKYIGFNTPTSTEKRKTPYRIAKLNDSDSSGSYFRTRRGLIGCVRRMTVSGRLRSPLSSPEMPRRTAPFESPIEKLLRKNRGPKSAPNTPANLNNNDEDMKEPKAEELQTREKICRVRLNRSLISMNEPADEPAQSVEEPEPDIKEDEIEVYQIVNSPAEQPEVIEEPSDMIVEEEKEAEEAKEEEPEETTQPQLDDPVQTEEVKEQEITVVDPTEAESPAVECLPPPPTDDTANAPENLTENPQTSEQLPHLTVENQFGAEDLLSTKSPSTFSVDSAKGSSLDNDWNWVSIQTGELFWGQIFQYCYWPCMVCPDPDGKTISVNENRTKTQHVMIHVRFFADNGRRGWVKRDNLMPYCGIDAYVKKMNEAELRYGQKSPKYKVFLVTKGKARTWNQAIREADEIESIEMEFRLDKFFDLIKENKVLNSMERKRRQSLYLHSSTSDIYSMFGSIDNLSVTHHLGKRDRSPTPVSPAYSPLGPRNSQKRIKLDSTEEVEVPSTSTEVERVNSQTADTLGDFKKYSSAMREFILNNRYDAKEEEEFMLHVRSLWAIRQRWAQSTVAAPQVASGSKRLSQRLRSLSARKSLPATPLQNKMLESASSSAAKKPKVQVRPIEEVIEDIYQLDSKYLFKGVSKEQVCKQCHKTSPDLIKCSKNCHGWLHAACRANYSGESPLPVAEISPAPFLHITGDLDESSIASAKQALQQIPSIICKECDSGPKCFVCKQDSADLGQLMRCNSTHCGKSFHQSCLKYWPQAKITKSSAGKLESFRCPAHVCHTCVSDDPKGKFLHIEKSKLTKCIKCPATYHMDSTCIPAGSQLLSTAWIICPKHSTLQEAFINVNWCFICVSGGKLVCCETCPTAVHLECLKIPVAEEGYICEECETGRMPLYGEMVWAKLSSFRWWPSLILPPPEVPPNLARRAHNPSEFVIRFFGTNDHAWISRKRVYLYQDGDCSEPPRNNKSGLDLNYNKGVEEAKRAAEIIKGKKIVLRASMDKKQRISPLPYVKIKQNRVVPPLKLQVNPEKISKCECDANSKNPCGQDSGCLNRVLFTECNPKICPAGERCQNQLFEKKVSPKLDVVYMHQKGFGLICLEPISAGTFVIEYVGEVIDHAEFRRRIAQKEQERDENFYFLTLERDYIIDAGPKGNLARFMNHSCEPNCETQKWSVNGLDRIGLFAIQDIPKNAELTFNYFWDELLGNEKKNCHCGAAKCAGLIGGKYKEPTKKAAPVVETKKKNKTKAKLKSPQQIRKMKAKAAARKGGKVAKQPTHPKTNLMSPTHTNRRISKLSPKISSPATSPTTSYNPSTITIDDDDEVPTSSPLSKQTEEPQL